MGTITITCGNSRVGGLLRRLLHASLQAADPVAAVHRVMKRRGGSLVVGKRRYALQRFDRIVCVGAGKAAGRMTQAVEEIVDRRLDGGFAVVKEGYGCATRRVILREAGHPVPDVRSARAGSEILRLAQSLTSRDLLIVLVSGGASSLAVAPVPGLSFRDTQRTTGLLMRSGAAIEDINAVRKHLSAIKGGRLAMATRASIVTLLLSDVPGNSLTAIGSGPTVPDPTTFHDVRKILQNYQLWTRLPSAVRTYIDKGMAGSVPETPKPKGSWTRRVHVEVIGSNALAVKGLAKTARAEGLHPVIMTTSLRGEAKEAGKHVGAVAREIHASRHPVARPACVVWGGELTVTLGHNGQGGRAQEFALSCAEEIAGLPHTVVAGFGTDGTDGPTPVAGAIVDGHTARQAAVRGLDISAFLERHDSYTFFEKAGGQIVTGPTGTNVNDVYLLLTL